MRDFVKSMARFSWAMSMFGARQATDLLNPKSRSQDQTGAAGGFDELSQAVVKQLGASLRQTFDSGEQIQSQMLDLMFGFWPRENATTHPVHAPVNLSVQPFPPDASEPSPSAIFGAHSTANEELLITFTRGRGRFSQDKRYIGLQNTLYNLDGRENGRHEGVWNALFKSPEDLLARPGVPTGPMTEPVGPVEAFPVSANTIAKWIHADGSSISSVGPAASHLIPLSNGGYLFLVITAQLITNGTGRFANVKGLTQSLGATYVEKGVDLFGGSVDSFPALTLDTFKIRRVASPPVNPPGRRAKPPTTPAAQPQSKFAQVHGSRMHYVDAGHGEPIIFLHGNPASSYLWRNVVPEVVGNARCIVPDLIGMGQSDKPDIEYSFFDHVKYFEGFLEQLSLNKYTLVLHDWGCIIGFYHAMRNERKVRAMAFMEAMFKPYPRMEDFPENVRPVFEMFRTPNVGYRKIVDENMFIEQVLPASMVRQLTPQEMDEYRRPFLDPPSRKLIWKFANQLPIAGEPENVWQATSDYARWLKRTELPKLLLWAKPGLITSERDVAWARRNLENLEDKCLGEGKHFHQEDHPVEIGQEVARWHSKVCRSRSSKS